MIRILILILIDFLSYITFAKSDIARNKSLKRPILIFHICMSLLTYYFVLRIGIFKGDFAENQNIRLNMSFAAIIATVWLPRLLIIIFFNLGKLVKGKHKKSGNMLINLGGFSALMIFIIFAAGIFHGRFNFRFKEVIIRYENIPEDLRGIRIVHLSDLHLSSFEGHSGKLEKLVEEINNYKPDIIVNTGDFVSFAAIEMENFTEILNGLQGKLGNYAVTGNHDTGIYHPFYDFEDRLENERLIKKLILESGYQLLDDQNVIIKVGASDLSIIGVSTSGKIPDIISGDLNKSFEGSDLSDFRLLLAHDPDLWLKKVEGKKNIELTLSGHTHGAQFGFIIGRLKWSPAKYFYPLWNGLYGKDDQYLYVNRGLGTLSIPFRLGMTPEITIIDLE